ncbi:MAG: glycosyltransferase [Bacteroidota bacterium]|nr:glycosyltransferase [Bacteroidota bacterium]
MKILFVTGNYLPGKNGGIENYVHWVATVLLQHQIIVEVAALNVIENADYFYDGVNVNYMNGSLFNFENLLHKGDFDICHFHEYSAFGGIEIPWFTKAREYCNKVYFTFHLPYFTCYKADFRYRGIEDCNNFSSTERCLNCLLAEKMNYTKNAGWDIKNSLIDLSIPAIKMLPPIKKIKANIQLSRKGLNELIDTCDIVFVVADWFRKILEDNGINSAKIKKFPPIAKTTNTPLPESSVDISKKMVFAGRVEKQKGLHLLCKAMNRIASKNIELDVFGNKVDKEYFNACNKEYAFNYKGVMPREKLLILLTNYDFLILPSVCTEMYSMILQEAFFEHVPVIASNSKGNMDMVTDGINGFLFEYDNARDLAATIDKAYDLKKKGWQPAFTYPENPEKDVEEIISYYC